MTVLSIDALTLPESLRALATFGSGPLPGTVVLAKDMLERFAASAQELLDEAQRANGIPA